ncbi:hypothetical protein SB771_35545, partial [Burkholderia sp. SIMBA_051]
VVPAAAPATVCTGGVAGTDATLALVGEAGTLTLLPVTAATAPAPLPRAEPSAPLEALAMVPAVADTVARPAPICPVPLARFAAFVA